MYNGNHHEQEAGATKPNDAGKVETKPIVTPKPELKEKPEPSKK